MTYNPEEQRDYRGRWTASVGDTMHTAPGFPAVTLTNPANAANAKILAEKAEEVSRVLDFDASKIIVTDSEHKFTINGHEYSEGGHYDPQSGYVTLRHALHPLTADGVISHEIEHAKFDALMKDYQAERATMEKDPDYLASLPKWEKAPGADDGTQRPVYPVGGKDSFMRPDGSLLEPYASRYPLYTKYNDVAGGTKKGTSTDDFAKSDGVSPYSKDYWEAWQNREVSTDSAMHETLAEMAKSKWAMKREKTEHAATVKKEYGADWTPEMEKNWRVSLDDRAGYRNYHLGDGDINGRKVYFATGKRVARKNWEDLSDLVDWNWKRRNARKTK